MQPVCKNERGMTCMQEEEGAQVVPLPQRHAQWPAQRAAVDSSEEESESDWEEEGSEASGSHGPPSRHDNATLGPPVLSNHGGISGRASMERCTYGSLCQKGSPERPP